MTWWKRKQADVAAREPTRTTTLAGRFNLATYNLQVFSPLVAPEDETSAYRWSDSDKRVMADLPAILEHVEEEITKLLPEGYEARITEWNK